MIPPTQLEPVLLVQQPLGRDENDLLVVVCKEEDDDSIPILHMMQSADLEIITSSPVCSSPSIMCSWSDIPCQGDVVVLEDPMQLCDNDDDGYLYTMIPPPPPPLVQLPPPTLSAITIPQDSSSIAIIDDEPPSPRSTMTHFHLTNEKKTMPPPFPTHYNGPQKDSSSLTALSPSRTKKRIKTTKKKTVTFGPHIYVRTHMITLGDHPCCTGGMALTCDWESMDSILPFQSASSPPSPRLLVEGEDETAASSMDKDDDDMTIDDVVVNNQDDSFKENDVVVSSVSKHRRRRRRMMELHLPYAARRQRLQDVTGMAGHQLLWEEYRLVCSSMMIQQQQQQK